VVDRIEDHGARALARTSAQYKGTRSHEGVLGAAAKQVQALEDALFDLLTIRAVDLSEGAQLDAIGAILGAEREGREDAVFRMRLRAQVLLNRSSGEAESIAGVLRLAVPTATAAEITDWPPARFELRLRGVSLAEDEASRAAALVRLARSGGVGGSLVYLSTGGAPTALRFKAEGDPVSGVVQTGASTGEDKVYISNIYAFPDPPGTVVVGVGLATAEARVYTTKDEDNGYLILSAVLESIHAPGELVELQESLGLSIDGVTPPFNSGNLAGVQE